ncbi:MAG TPA: ATP-binding protein [Ktedonobacteraceae bacterium]|nr:ATP-binding protein [Ktedonobacteraceae bacterium]
MIVAGCIQTIVEQFQQLLGCQVICFMPGCSDTDLCHPLLEMVPEVCSAADLFEGTRVTDIWQEECVRALSDLSVQSGRMQVLNACESLVKRWRLRSIAAVPLESSRGVLGVFLLVDERADQFSVGEERLLYACLSICVPYLEKLLWAQARLAVLAGLRQEARGRSNENSSSEVPGQFIRSEFVSMVGHELRTPLSVIKGYAGLLQMYGGSDEQQVALERGPLLGSEQQRHYLDVIMEQTSLLEILVADLLDISRLQRGQLALRPRAVDIEALCRQVIGLARVRADQMAEGKYRLECKLAAHLAPVWADPARVQQVLLNLLENAIKYSPKGGRIELEVTLVAERNGRCLAFGRQRIPRQVCITIRDQGMGISMQHAGRLFEPFERLEQSTSSRIPGMGLGLYIARKLIEAMDGKIELQSCEGRGTNVTIHLPVAESGGKPASEVFGQAPSLRIG